MSDHAPKTGVEKIIDFFNGDLEINHPVTLKEIVDKTTLSYTFVKKTLDKFKKEEYCGFNYEQSGSTWIAWKDREHITKQLDNTCGHMLKE